MIVYELLLDFVRVYGHLRGLVLAVFFGAVLITDSNSRYTSRKSTSVLTSGCADYDECINFEASVDDKSCRYCKF